VDSLGRLVRVDEPDSFGSVGTLTAPTLPTSYGYDQLGNLLQVQQGAQQRTFTYDSLSRLKSAKNPEQVNTSGQMVPTNYEYDDSGNLRTRTDARGVTATHTYDGLNRVQTRTYSGPAPGGTTPMVTYVYDALGAGLNGKGRLTSVNSSVSSSSYASYDVMGRVLTANQTTDGQTYTTRYQYNLAGSMTSETYPSNRVVVTEYDAAGRIAGVKTNAALYYAGGTPSTANAMSYTAHGANLAMRLGNGKWEHTNFNSRLQPEQIGLGTSGIDSSLMRLDYTYGTTNNNGNVLSQNTAIGGMTLTQGYTYDELNRLKTASENSGASWSQTYGYDRFGNRWVSASPGYTLNSLTTQSQSAFNTGSNRLVGSQYDAAGNQTVDAQNRTFSYDGENRQTTFNGTTGQYFYDGDGRRVKKIDGNGTTIFVYNVVGQLLAEYHSDPVPASAVGGGTSYLTTDHLGSTRVVTDGGGNVRARYDYLPFGEELGAAIGPRTVGMGYSAVESTKQKFTQKERDSESGLDYFLARYYSSSQGRFTSVDPALTSGKQMAPQSWNRYVYALNNPLVYVDDNGKWPGRKHDLIIETALPGLKGTRALQEIKLGSRSVDMGESGFVPYTLLQSESYKHAMVSAVKVKELGGYDAAREWTEKEMNKFIQDKLNEAKANVSKFQISVALNGFGDENYLLSAQKAFGQAIHPIMDRVSPAHRDFQIYDTSEWKLSLRGIITAASDISAHAKLEDRDPTQDEMQRMVEAIQRLYGDVFNANGLKEAITEKLK
jgi:RHS repeat-associated protein